MENYIGKICPFCKTEIKEGDSVKVCPACGIPHHEGCWEENRGCTTFGCAEQHYEAQHTNPTDVCQNCGAPLGDGQDFCPKCGTPKNAVMKNVCGKCGAELQDGQEFCPKCGQKAGLAVDAGVNAAINQFNYGVEKKKEKDKKIPLIIGAAVLVVVLAVVIFGKGGSKDFNDMYEDIADEYWCTIASDGTWMQIDTNPYDIDDSFDSDAWDAIKTVLDDLHFSSYVSEEMNQTTALMGKQSASADGYEVTWSYHPDRGMEAMFRIVE